jgi:hypothetical protein
VDLRLAPILGTQSESQRQRGGYGKQ